WKAIAQVKAAGIPVGICVTPMLPPAEPDAFIHRLTAFRPDVLVVQDFHDSGGGFGADTGAKARRLLGQWDWTIQAYRRVVEVLQEYRHVYEGEAGFFPPAVTAPWATA